MNSAPRTHRIRALRAASVALLSLAFCGAASANQGIDNQATYQALVHRTGGGVPHVRADDFASLGFGTGYAMAEDLICTLAERFLTFGAERARFLGPTGQNIASDFFFQLLIDRGEADEPVDPRQAAVFRGAAAGYNRYLRDTGVDNLPDPRCRGAAWVREIGEIDFRRISRTNFFLPFIHQLIVGAQPPPPATAATSDGAPALASASPGKTQAMAIPSADEIAALVRENPPPDITALLDEIVPRHKGSNGIALGHESTVDGTGMLLANPHQPWTDPDRFYMFHQTLPGELDVLGANVIGRPQVGVGTTEHVAWTNTVSTAERFSFFLLFLAGDTTTYLFDGVPRPMIQETVTIQAPVGPGGALVPLSHTFYSTHFGAFLVAFGWTQSSAVAVLPAGAGWRGIDSLVDQYQATTVQELKAVHDAAQFTPVNLIAADSSGQTLFTDPGPIPNLTDFQINTSVFQGGCDISGLIAGFLTPCQWGNDPTAAVPGLLGPGERPSLIRTDYVSNSNDSFWLANPAAPISRPGRNEVLGPEGQEQSLRTRSTNQMIERRLAGTDGLGTPGFTLGKLQTLALSNQNQAGQILNGGLVSLCTANPTVGGVDVSEACDVLATQWDLKADLGSVGAHVFREFIRNGNGGRRLPSAWNYLVPFDVTDPLRTPRDLDPVNNPAALTALADAVSLLTGAGIDLDASLGSLQSVTRQGEVIPLHGGIEASGVFNKIEAAFDAVQGGYPEVTASSSSWIQATEFAADGPVMRGFLTYSLSTNPESPRFADQTKLFSQKQWVELPFREADVIAAATESLDLREGRSDCNGAGWEAFTNPSFEDRGECVDYYNDLRDRRFDEIEKRNEGNG
jgi:acyl-homoserine-lactone acylase